MEKLTKEQRESIKKLNTDRLRARLVKLGVEEELAFTSEREDLLNMMAEIMLQPQPVAAISEPTPAETFDMRRRELELKEKELDIQLEMHRQQLQAERQKQAEQTELQRQQLEVERQQQAALLQQQAAQQVAQREQYEQELELRKAEIRLQEQRAAEELRIRREEIDRLRLRDEQQAERENSLASQTKRYGDILKHVLPRMPSDPGELINFFDTCENLWALYQVPIELRAKLLLPLLTPKAKSLINRLDAGALADVEHIKTFLLNEFRLTSREYRARFNAATRAHDETHALFSSRLKNLWGFYMKSRECTDYDKLVDLIVADRLKDSLSGPCLKYCLSIEGNKVLSSSELAALADTFDANYSPDGRYRGGTVLTYKDEGSRGNAIRSQVKQPNPSRPVMSGVGRGFNNSATTQSVAASNSGSNNDSRSNVKLPRKCWICHSPSHLQSDCPEKVRAGGNVGKPRIQSSACRAFDGVLDSPEDETALMKAQVNRCVVEIQRDDQFDIPVTIKVEQQVNNDSDTPVNMVSGSCNDADDDKQGQVISKSPDITNVVCKSPLTYIQLFVENHGPFKCLADSGTEMPVAKRSVVQDLMSPVQSVGQIKLQGIFGEPVLADLVSLQVYVASDQNCDCVSVPLVFAVTDAMVQNCDFIVPADIVCMLNSHGGDACEQSQQTSSSLVVTRSQAKNTPEDNDDSLNDSLLSEPEPANGGDGCDSGVNSQPTVETDTPELVNIDSPTIYLNNESDRDELINEQKTDATLDPCWRLAAQNKGGMFIENSILYHRDEVCGHVVQQLCVPHGRRLQVMRLAHDAVVSGHLGDQKTRERIRLNFYWPNMKRDITSYTASCHPCQLRARAKRTDHVPITPIVRPTVPFVVCHADVIGPIDPPSAKGHKWALCVIDDCTRWPAVFLLRSLTAKAICDAFFDLFSITGWPEVIATDRASNFCNQLTREFLTRMGVAPRLNTAYHPEAAGVIERFNGSFKNMLHHAIQDYGRQWHRVVPCLVWALREVTNKTTSVSPHFLLFGRVPRGPLSILKETWTGAREHESDAGKPVSQYLNDLERDMRNAEKYAREHADIAQAQYAKYYNARAKNKAFQVGEQVVVLEKDSTHKIFARWKHGKIIRVRSPYSYDVEMPDGSRRQLHANKLRPFVARVQHIGIIKEQDRDFGVVEHVPISADKQTESLPSQRITSDKLQHLEPQQRQALLAVLDDFADVFSDFPGLCTVVQHEIHVTSDFRPRMTRAYRVPEILKREIERQVDELLMAGFIVPSRSPMASGVVCVLKPDKSIRMACDYRYLNSYSIGDGHPMPVLSEVIYRVGQARYTTVCDAKSGYYQLLVKPEHRWLTAFTTHHGLWEWTRMPFGLKSAGNSFVRAVQAILHPIRDFSDSYVDDLSVFSDDFDGHLCHLRQFLTVVRASGLTLNLKKCSFAKQEVKYLGHIIGCGLHRPDPERLKAVAEMKPPTTKKQLRQVLGLLSYYRSYVKNFAEIAKPLTDLTGGKKPTALKWGDTEQRAFDTLRRLVCESPVCSVPVPGKPFNLYTDASAIMVGCQLAQCDDVGVEHPVAFASQKLTATQCAWSVIEREAFAIVWSLNRFRNIIFGSRITVFTDHNPLKFLSEGAPKSAKLTRWSLGLQEYDLILKYTRSACNSVADCLSRVDTA